VSNDKFSLDANTGESISTSDSDYADAFGRSNDPLAQYSDAFYKVPDPFAHFVKNVLENRDRIESEFTTTNYQRTYRQWRTHMESVAPDRHPACPNSQHVKSFIEWQRDVHDNSRRTIKGKLSRLAQAYEYWQDKPDLPHPPDYHPFEIARKETSLGNNPTKNYYDLTLEALRVEFQEIENILHRAIIGLQLKQGERASEVCNLKIPELNLSHQEVQTHYPELGTHPAIGDRTDVIYVPQDRDGNKSSNPRLIPIDNELRWLLIRYLLTRPQVDEPWVFLSKRTFTQMDPNGVNDIWKEEFHPEYGETEKYKPITSHFGRHWFSSWCRLEIGMSRENVQYLRGDKVAPIEEFPDAIDEYLHPNYELIEDSYRSEVFNLDIQRNHIQIRYK